MTTKQPPQQSESTGDAGEPRYCLTPYAPFRRCPTNEDLQNILLFNHLESGYTPFGLEKCAILSELFETALGVNSKPESPPDVTGQEGTRLYDVQLRLREAKKEFAEAEQAMAAYYLVDAVCWGITMIDILVANKPELMSKLASGLGSWPVDVGLDSDWHGITERLKGLKLGQGESAREVHPGFHPAQGDDAQLPARRWAKQAVASLATTRNIQIRLAAIPTQRLLKFRCKIAPAPAWVFKASRLRAFTSEKRVVLEWGSLIREMIRQQIPDFHTLPEWANFKRTSRSHSNKPGAIPTKGVIQNAILDDIVAALKTIAPRDIPDSPT